MGLDMRNLKRLLSGLRDNFEVQQETFSILQSVYHKMLPVIAAFAGISLLASLIQTISGKANYFFWALQAMLLVVIIAATFIRHRISSMQMFALILTVIYILAVGSLLNRGLAGSGMIHLLFFCVFAAVFLGLRRGVLILAFSVLTLMVISIGIFNGWLPQKNDAAEYLVYPVNWIIHSACMVMYTYLLMLSVKGLHGEVVSSRLELKKNNNRLEAEVSTRKEAEKALIESEAKYRNVVENSLAGFFITQRDRLRFVNRRGCEMTGYSPEEITAVASGMGIIHPDDRDKFSSHVKRCLTEKTPLLPFDVRIIRKDGEIIILKTTINVTIYKNERSLTGTFIDITREKQLESQLRQAQRMEAIGQLAGGIAHDFNNILTVFNGYGNILKMKMSPDDPLRIYVEQILSAAQKASSLTQNLLIFSRRQPITIEAIDINQAIGGTAKLLRRLLTEDIIFNLDLSPDKITALVDTTQFDRILFNLVSNARDAMPQGGNLSLKTDLVFLDNDFRRRHGFGEPGRYAHIIVSDSGMGMDKETLEKIFNPFFTTKAVGEGTGLGLATVYGIVKQHKGFIIAESTPGQGADFHVYLPAAISAIAEKDDHVPSEMKTGTERILIADDNEAVRSFIRDGLSMAGYQIIEAIDGDDAVYRFRDDGKIDLVILDSVMPKRNGREAFHEIVKMNPQIKALFISGHTRDVVLNKGISERDVHFLPKPVSLQLLLNKVREVLEEGAPERA